MTSSIRLDGKIAAVTGAGNGLGRAYALELASRGAHVVVSDLGGDTAGVGRDESVARAVVAEITAAGGTAAAHVGDVSSPEDMQAMVDLAITEWGRLDILVNNAGGAGGDMLGPVKSWDRAIGVNLYGVVNTLRAAWPHFEKQRYGRVVNTSSSSMLGTPQAGTYASAKAGVVGLTKVLASTYPDSNIKVNVIMPIAGTRLFARMGDTPFANWVLGNFKPEQVAAFIPVLCRDELSISGEVFTVGGGRAARVLFETTDGWWEQSPTAESFLSHFDDVMAGRGARFASSGAADLVRYATLFDDPGPFGPAPA